MRDLLNLIDGMLTESVGLANRKPGQTFVNDAGDKIAFSGLVFYPEEGKYSSPDLLDDAIKSVEMKGSKVRFVNDRNARTGAFGIATFTDSNNKVIRFGRYFDKISPIYSANNWPNSSLPDGYRYNSKSSLKMSSGLMPQDVLTSFEDLTPADILDQVVKHFGPDHPLTHLTNGISKGQPLPISIDVSGYPDLSFEGFRDYFGEILQPMAVLNGLTEGNAEEAAEKFFGKGGFKGATITFNTGKNDGLADSLIVKNGVEIKLSSKGGAGAKASVKNLVDAIEEITKTGNTQLLKDFEEIVQIVNVVKREGQANSPLALATMYQLITEAEADEVRKMREGKKFKLTSKLQKWYDDRASGADQSKLVPFYNMLAAIAFRVADHINENTNFSSGAATILNNGALVQVYTIASESNGQFIIEKFRSVYPSQLVSSIAFSAQKTYFSSGIKGNFTFAVQKAEPSPEPRSIAPAVDKKIKSIAQGTSSEPIVKARQMRGEPGRAKR